MQEQVDERISVRFETKMINEIDALVKEMGYPNRSEFLRTAVRTQMSIQQQENSISVKVAPLVLEYINTLVSRGYYRSQEHAIQAAIDGFFTEENVKQAFKAMKRMEIVAGKKIEADLENNNTSRQIITK
jgi:Arc/MetJ-type ribon-helix-helix transcriptional regulator